MQIIPLSNLFLEKIRSLKVDLSEFPCGLKRKKIILKKKIGYQIQKGREGWSLKPDSSGY